MNVVSVVVCMLRLTSFSCLTKKIETHQERDLQFSCWIDNVNIYASPPLQPTYPTLFLSLSISLSRQRGETYQKSAVRKRIIRPS